MQYTEEEIKKYLDILHKYGTQQSWDNYKNKTEESKKPKCKLCRIMKSGGIVTNHSISLL